MKNRLWTLPFRFHGFRFPRRKARGRSTDRSLRGFRPQLETLEDRLAPAITALGAGPGGPPLVTLVDETDTVVHSFNAYDVGFGGGVSVAVGDLNGDNVADIVTAAGAGGGPHVKVFDGVSFAEVQSFFAYDPRFTGGVNVAVADVNADGLDDIITGAGAGGGPHVKVFDGRGFEEVGSFFAYDAAFTGGVNVGAGDLNGDHFVDIITGAGAGGGPHVKAFDGFTGNEVVSFFAYDAAFTGGVNVGAGDVDGNGTVDLITGAGPGGGPHLRAWTAGQPPTLITEFFATDIVGFGGVRVGSIPGEGVGDPDLIAATDQSVAAPLLEYDLTGSLLDSSNFAGAGGGLSISSDTTQPSALAQVDPEMPTTNVAQPTNPDYNDTGDPNSLYFSDPILDGTQLFNGRSVKKTITFTNNLKDGRTLYPFFASVNDGISATATGVSWDANDNRNDDYRGYIGYQKGGKNYFGLPAGASITVTVPIAFWDGGRIYFTTNDKYLIGNGKAHGAVGAADNNPFNYFDKYDWTFQNKSINGKSFPLIHPLRKLDTTNVTGAMYPAGVQPALMWYHAANPPPGVAAFAPESFTEYTIRDPYQATLNPKLDKANQKGELGPLINYDVSFVDSLMYPLSMEATDVPVPNNLNVKPAYGWVGAPHQIADLQKSFELFTSDKPSESGLGHYFPADRGWTDFNLPTQFVDQIKLPSGANVFQLSPYADHESSYDLGTGKSFVLTSAGTTTVYRKDTENTGTFKKGDTVIKGVKSTVIAELAEGMVSNNFAPSGPFLGGTAITKLNADSIELSQPAQQDSTATSYTFFGSQFTGSATANGGTLTLANPSLLASLKVNMLVTTPDAGILSAGTRILSISTDPKNPTVTIGPGATGSGSHTFTFKGGVSDYVTERIMGLWYGWANYYVDVVVPSKNPFVGDISGGTILATNRRQISFATDTQTKSLLPGMFVSNPALPDGTVITSFGPDRDHPDDKRFINLSQVASGPTSGSFKFDLPVKVTDLIKSTSFVPKFELKFDVSVAADAERFATELYVVMAALSRINAVQNPDPTNPSTVSLMINVLGYNAGFLKDKIDGRINAELRDKLKSLLRGVYDFVKVPESTGKWYPDPAIATTGATINSGAGAQPAAFNVFNLDPYVWFVHRKLGISGYGFSVDDDVSDVGAEKATNLQINFSGLDPLTNKAEWTYGAPYGPVNGQGTGKQGLNGKADRIINLPQLIWNQLGEPDLASGNEGALVNGPGVQPGTRVAKRIAADVDDKFIVELTNPLGQYGAGTYSFFGPVNATGTIDPKGAPKIISGLATYVTDQLLKINANNTIANGALVVHGPGISTATFAAPTITGFRQTSGPQGSQVTITGANFVKVDAVAFNGVATTNFLVLSSTQILVTVPTGATTGLIGVSAIGGIAVSATPFTVTATTGKPIINAISPAAAIPGSTVTITGTNLGTISAVKFVDANAVTPASVTATQVTVRVPENAETGVIGVGGGNGETTSSALFTVVSPGSAPMITSFTPASGPAGSVVAIYGKNFLDVAAVAFDGKATTKYVVDSPSEIRVTVPEGATTGVIGVAAHGGVGTSLASFVVTAGPATGVTRVVKVNKDSVELDQPLEHSQPAGAFINQFKFS